MPASLSRRNFFRLATDSLVSLPVVAGGFLALTPTEALADSIPYSSELDGGAYYGAGAEIVVVNRWEVGFMLVDMSDGGESRIPGAKVEVQSRYNTDKWARGTTDEYGVLVLDIAELAENDDHKDPYSLDAYAFNGSITITCEGYRDFKVSKIRISGGGGMMVPGRSITDTKPYPELASFDEWDVLYTIETYETYDKSTQSTTDEFLTFNASPKNDANHSIVVTLRNLSGPSTTVKLAQRADGKVLRSQTVIPIRGAATATFTGTFLKIGSVDALPLLTDLDIRFSDGGIDYSFPIKLRAKKTVFDEPKSEKNKSAKPLANIKNSTGGGSGLAFTLPPSFPLGAGDLFTMWLPEFPANLYVDPSGYYQFTLKTPSWGYKNDYGKEDEKGWQKFSRKTVKDQIEDKKKSWDSIIDKTSSAYGENSGVVRQVNYSRTFSFSGFFQFVAVAQWDEKNMTFQGDAAGQFVLALLLTITEQFLAGPIPVFIQFDLKASLVVSLGPGFFVTPGPNDKDWTDVVSDLSRYEWDFTNSGLTFTVIISPSLSVGVGVSGVASISLRGVFTLSIFVGITARESSDKPLPHVIIGYNYRADLVVQFLLWTYTGNIFNGGDNNWVNNWETNGLNPQADTMAFDPMATRTLDEVIDQVNPVSDEMLMASREFDGNTPITAQEEGSQFYLDVAYEDCVMEDGTVLTCAVQTMKVVGMEEAQAEGAAPLDAPDESGAQDVQALVVDQAEDQPSSELLDLLVEQAITEQDESAPGLGEHDPDTSGLDSYAVTLASQEDGDDADAEESTEDLPAQTDDGQAVEQAPTSDEDAFGEGDEPANEALEPLSDEEQIAASPFAYLIPGDYTPVYGEQDEGGVSLTAMADKVPGIAGIGEIGGIRPELDTPIVTNVFGDPHIQYVSIDGTDYTLRIGSVTVNGKPLTRIIATVQGGHRAADIGKRQVLDFGINPAIAGFERDNLCDLEFGAVSEQYNEQHGMISTTAYRMHISVISAKRNTVDFGKSITDMVFSHVIFHHDRNSGFNWVMHSTSRKAAEIFTNTPDYPYHCFSNLQLFIYAPANQGRTCTVTYLDRMSTSPDDVLRSSNVKVRVGILFVSFASTGYLDNTRLIVPDPATIEEKMGPITDLSAYELQFWNQVDSVYTFMVRGAKQSDFYIMRRNMGDSGSAAIMFVKHVGTTDASVRLHAWKVVAVTGGYSPLHAQQFLTCDENDRLCTAIVDGLWGGGAPKLTFTPQGADDFGIRSFGVWGDFIYWPEVRNGVPGHSYSEDSDSLVEMPEVSECRIKAARLRGSHHSDDFILADLGYVSDEDPGHLLDNIVSIGGNNTALSVIASELTDKDKDLATIWYIAVPFVKTVTALSATAVVPFVSPGKVAGFYLALRNDGNTFLSACELAMYDKETMYDETGALKPPVATCNLVFSKDTVCESAWNPKDENGDLKGLESDYALAPGKVSVYRAEIVIPESWASGRKEVIFVARNSTVVSGMEGQAEGEEDIIVEYSVDPGSVMMDMLVIEEPYWKAASYGDAPVTVYGEGETPSPSGGGGEASGSGTSSGGTGGSSTSGGNKRKMLPDTGDERPSAALGLLGAGLAAAGAVVSAYERRRAENEQR
ncbi:MAG: hypothetical protein Q4C09_00770 [Atopobiaceae bacterium]|nr:hypothetical protein [Atopobiaceae bacterium]